MLPDRTSPSSQRSRQLAQVGHSAKTAATELEDHASDVYRVHLLVLPGPQQGMVDSIAELLSDRHGLQPLHHQLFAVGDGNNFLPLESQKAQANHFPPRIPRILPAPQFQLLLEFF